MPLRHQVLGAWYTQLAQALDAGLTLRDALALPVAGGGVQRTAGEMWAAIEQGGSVDDALRAAGNALPEADRLTLSAAAEIGTLPVMLRRLSDRHQRVAVAQTRMLLACAYPIGVLHLGVLLAPVLRMIDWNQGFRWSTGVYVETVLALLVPFWTVVAVAFALARRRPEIVRAISVRLPGLGRHLQAQALSDLAFLLGSFVGAGVRVSDAWAAVGLVTTAPELRTAANALSEVAERGQPPGTELARWRCFPTDFVAAYRTGETSGQLDVALLKVSEQQQQRAEHGLTLVMILYPALVFLAVACLVGSQVLSVYGGYLRMLTKMAE
ncbi:type II secretion system F family protein [Opitutus sp. ER46]|uniref:type II secretion system F family protein n=1 Tax=Opitutus sp. ER46 TaxID=2161864 RepID=UPI001304BD32|nr:type II secretion system F family protein [Opitutus sp. ER46]